MSEKQLPPSRLFLIMARSAHRAIIFRRGPSRWTQVILWDTKNDKFEYGHWFKGRIYERRCDLSPDGNLLIYFVSKFNKKTLSDADYTYAWTAISKPPWLTVLALWPKGDCWHGGGLFEENKRVFLNHRPEVAKPHPHHMPKHVEIVPNPNASGEDDPLYSMRLERDGWKLAQKWTRVYKNPPRFYETLQPEIRTRRHPSMPYQISMSRSLDRLEYTEKFRVTGSQNQVMIDVDGVSWADWDHRGRLVILKDGKLFIGHEDVVGVSFRIQELADFNPQVPQTKPAPAWATKW